MTTFHDAWLCSKPLAAYRLGMLSNNVPLSIQAFQRSCLFDQPERAIQGTLRGLQEAALTLATDIPVNVYNELRSCLKSELKRWSLISTAVRTIKLTREYVVFGKPSPLQLIQSTEYKPQVDLAKVVSLTAESLPSLRHWVYLGQAVGDCYGLLLRESTSDATPAVLKIAELACAVPKEQSTHSPTVQRMVEATPRITTFTPAAFLQEVTQADAGESSPSVVDCLWALDKALHLDLGRIGHFQPSVPPGPAENGQNVIPRWDKLSRRLYWKEQLSRKVAPQASRIVELLNAFDDQGWPPAIDNPWMQSTSTRGSKAGRADDAAFLRDVVDSLSTGLKWLKFRAIGGTAISWEAI